MINFIDDIVTQKYWANTVVRSNRCWGWSGPFTDKGRPRIFAHGDSGYAHRISYLLHKGPIPKGLVVCHTCDNPECTNPDHLWIGTHADNQRDCARKNRRAKGFNNGKHTKPESTPRGEGSSRSKLTNDDIRRIRSLEGTMSQQSIGLVFNTPQTNISQILRGNAWKHVS